MRQFIRTLMLLIALTVSLIGCAPASVGPSVTDGDVVERDLDTRIAEAIALHSSDPEGAMQRMEAALLDAPFHGPSYNNLGVLHLHQGDLHRAAGAFDEARRLLPGHPDPRLNLGLLYERGGRLDDAVRMYESALEVRPRYPPALAGLARTLLRLDTSDERIERVLCEIRARHPDAEWRKWAIDRLNALSATSPDTIAMP